MLRACSSRARASSYLPPGRRTCTLSAKSVLVGKDGLMPPM